MNKKGCGIKRLWPFEVIFRHVPGATKEYQQKNRSPDPDFNWGTPAYETGVTYNW
jgi:hypothetical protein